MPVNYLKSKLRHYRLRLAGVVEPLGLQATQIGGWAVLPDCVRAGEPVYSFGVGDKIGWDLGMIRRFGVTVHAFDPTPGSIAWVAGQTLPPQFVFHPLGISNFDGELDFYPPRQAGNTHFTQERRGWRLRRPPPVKGQVRRLASIMRDLGHQRLALLKLDVEGSEFEAIPDIVKSDIEIDQLLVEIHYHFGTRSFAQGLTLVRMLKAAGLACVFVSPRALEFTFVRRSLLKGLSARPAAA